MKVLTKAFWADTIERALATAAEAAVATLGAGALDVIHTDWQAVASVSAGAGLLTVLKCVAASRLGAPTASMGEDYHYDADHGGRDKPVTGYMSGV